MTDRQKIIESLNGLKEILKLQRDVQGYGAFIGVVEDAAALLKEQTKENEKVDEAIDYVKWVLASLNSDTIYDFKEVRQTMLSVLGYLVLLKS